MIIGNPATFAIEATVDTRVDEQWLLGKFRFWCNSITIGDWEDTVDLQGSASWLEAFCATTEISRYEEEFASLSATSIFELLYQDIFVTPYHFQRYTQAYSRFSIAHLGMSSFDKWYIFLVETPDTQHILWKSVEGTTIYEAILPSKEMQRVEKHYLRWFNSQKHIHKRENRAPDQQR